MPARLRLSLIALLALPIALGGLPAALGSHEQTGCPDQPGLDSDWCHKATPAPTPKPTPQPTPKPATPAPTVRPSTPAPTARATARPRRTSAPRRDTTTTSRTPAPTPMPTDGLLGSPSPTPLELGPDLGATPEIIVGPIALETPEPGSDTVENQAASGSAGWAFFLVGLIVGFLLRSVIPTFTHRRKRKQQIFG